MAGMIVITVPNCMGNTLKSLSQSVTKPSNQIFLKCTKLSCVVLVSQISLYIHPIPKYSNMHDINLLLTTSIFNQLLLRWYYKSSL